MYERELYEESWRLQDAQAVRDDWRSRIRKRYSNDRYQLAVNWLRDLSGSLLDVGCGRGEIVLNVPSQFKQLVGLDISQTALDAVRQASKQNHRSQLIQVNLNERWPLADATFDVVTCVAVLEHLFDPAFVVGEIARVLKNNGRAIIVVPNIAYFRHRAALLLGRLPETSGDSVGWDGGHLHYFTFDALRALLAQKGLSIEKRGGDGMFGELRAKFWPNLSVGNLDIRAVKSAEAA